MTPPTLPACVLEHRSSADLEPALRHAAWQEIAHRWVDFRPAPEVPLEAELTTLSSGVCTLGATRSSAYEMRTGARRAQPDDMVVLTLMQSGDLLPQAYPRKGPGALSLCAPREAGAYRWGQGARQVFLALPRQGAAADLPDLHECLHTGRHAAALRFMEQQAHRHDLDAAAIAQGAGCSRTRLYEAFAAQGQTVMGVLRDMRLQRAQGLLAQGQRLNVGALAWRCGFADASGFSKLFRARFGLSPTEWHQRAHTGAHHERS